MLSPLLKFETGGFLLVKTEMSTRIICGVSDHYSFMHYFSLREISPLNHCLILFPTIFHLCYKHHAL